VAGSSHHPEAFNTRYVGNDGRFDILDAHHHVGQSAQFSESHRPRADHREQYSLARDLEIRLNAMDLLGVRQAVLLPTHAYLRPRGLQDTEAINNAVAEYRLQSPSRFPAIFGIAEPAYGPDGMSEIARLKGSGFSGISFHVRFQGPTLTAPLMFDYVGEVCAQQLTPIIHVAAEVCDEALWRLEELAGTFPDTTFMAVDVFGSREAARQSFMVAKRTDNILFDTSLAGDLDLLLAFSRELGAHRLAYGTDLHSGQVIRGKHVLWSIIESRDLADEEKAMILGGNFRRILHLDPRSPADGSGTSARRRGRAGPGLSRPATPGS
jgi:predicted TIM-barrel fold metal-dependent hydrolase